MISKNVKVNLPTDAEARPVAVTVQIASKYDSRIFIVSGDKKINAKSIMGMMSLGFVHNDELIVQAEGDDAEAAVAEIANYIQSGE
ncbi:MAG: HPr family phosphocarrier protein [Lachnospiraceae bacterium]|nr:HPr family phosphocarrier protein [Lachnospiraceae bacterium]